MAMAVAVESARTPTESLLFPVRKDSTIRENDMDSSVEIMVHQ